MCVCVRVHEWHAFEYIRRLVIQYIDHQFGVDGGVLPGVEEFTACLRKDSMVGPIGWASEFRSHAADVLNNAAYLLLTHQWFFRISL